jgi:hypothetical protein
MKWLPIAILLAGCATYFGGDDEPTPIAMACPAEAPPQGDYCGEVSDVDARCSYPANAVPTTVCECVDRAWRCYGACPTTQPPAEPPWACEPILLGHQCEYGGVTCTCTNFVWQCGAMLDAGVVP